MVLVESQGRSLNLTGEGHGTRPDRPNGSTDPSHRFAGVAAEVKPSSDRAIGAAEQLRLRRNDSGE